MSMPATAGWWDPSFHIIDLRGRVHVLNIARPITLKRVLKAAIGFREHDTVMAKRGGVAKDELGRTYLFDPDHRPTLEKRS